MRCSLQHVRAYGLTDDVDDGDGPDLSLPRSDAKPQVRSTRAAAVAVWQGSDHRHRFRLLNRMLLMFAGRLVLVQWRITSRFFSRAFCLPTSSHWRARSRQSQRYLSDVEGQRLEKAGGEPGPTHAFEDAAFDNEGAGDEDFDRDLLMSQVFVWPMQRV